MSPSTVIGRFTLDPELFIYDPSGAFENLTVEQVDEMNDAFREAWFAKADEILDPLSAWINPSTGEIIAPVESQGMFTEDVREALSSIDADSQEFFTAWAKINERQT